MTQFYTGTLTETTCWCGIRHAVPKELYDFQKRQHDDGVEQRGIYCPLGHTHIHAGESKSKVLELQLQAERARLDQAKAALQDKQNELNAQKAAKARIQNRVARGVCPCCNQTFRNLAAHMKTKHPEELGEHRKGAKS